MTKQHILLCIRVIYSLSASRNISCWMSHLNKSLKIRIFKFSKIFFYDILLHFKSFNQMAFVSDIYFELLKILSFQDKVSNNRPTTFSRSKIIWMNSPTCQLTILAIRHWIYLKASMWGMIVCCMHSPSLFSGSILGQNCHIDCHNLQMTGPACLKLGILAL